MHLQNFNGMSEVNSRGMVGWIFMPKNPLEVCSGYFFMLGNLGKSNLWHVFVDFVSSQDWFKCTCSDCQYNQLVLLCL